MALGKSRLGKFLSGKTKDSQAGHFRTFARDEGGAMFILALFLFATLLIFSGLSIDLMRYELQRTRLQSTLDRALLAAAHPDQENDRKGVVLDYFERAGLGGIVEEDNVKVIVGPDGTIVEASATMNVGTPFLSWSGVDYLGAPASGGAAKINQLTEISLVVDVSGSMGDPSTTGNSKIQELRKAALEFSNLLLCNPNDATTSTNCTITKRKTSLTLVPYSTQVNVGQTILSKFDRQDAQTDAYCVTFQDDDFKNVRVKPHPDMVSEPEKLIRQAAKFYRYGNSYRSTNTDAYLSCHTDTWREVVAFQHSPTVMKTKIQSLGAEGDTAIDIGMKWGAAFLHHETQPAITDLIGDGKIHADFANRPYDPGKTASSKFLVLMTDGQNTNHHHLFDGYRTGPSPFWVTHAPYRNSSGNERSREIFSVYRASTDTYQWFYYRGSNRTPVTEWHDHQFGDLDTDCFDAPNNTPYYDKICATEPLPWWINDEPRVATPDRFTYEALWKDRFTWGFLQRFPWLGTPGRKISNSDNSDGDPAGIKDIDQRLLYQCSAAKNAGITIYTIEMETPSTATDAMQACASTKDGKRLHYKVSGLDISTVFSKIAADINKLRLTH